VILWGRIQDFPIFAVLQFLAQYRKSGVLEIQDFEEFGSVFLTEGRVDAISLPLSDDLLGKRLVAAGVLTEEQLRECLLEAHEGDTTEPLGLLLLRRGYTDRATLQEIVNQQIYDQALELSDWRTGTFKFTVPEQPIQFPITPSIDVQTLLLDASRRLDEGDRPRREKVVVEDEICLTCTVECNEHIKARFLKNDVCLWRNMPAIAKDHLFPGTRKGRRRQDEEDEFQDLPFL